MTVVTDTVATHRDHEHTAVVVPSMTAAAAGSTDVAAIALSVPVTAAAAVAPQKTDAPRLWAGRKSQRQATPAAAAVTHRQPHAKRNYPQRVKSSVFYSDITNVQPVPSVLMPDSCAVIEIAIERLQHSHSMKRMIAAARKAKRYVCPFAVDVWTRMLEGYVPSDSCYTATVLIAGILHGHYVRYEGSRSKGRHSRNHPVARANHLALLALVEKEVELGRYRGPVDQSKLPPGMRPIVVSPLNLADKNVNAVDTSRWRLIHDLSSPKNNSVNDGIAPIPTQWQLVSHALQMIVNAGRGCHLLKMDVKSAYRQIAVHIDDWHLFGIMIEDELFIDTFLPFGCRASGAIWERYGQAMQWMLEHKYNTPASSRWVDDFLWALSATESAAHKATIEAAFIELGVPMDPNKTQGPSPEEIYIGYSLNTNAMTIGVSHSKRKQHIELAEAMLQDNNVTISGLRTLIGKLEHDSMAVRLGRSYMHALYTLQAAVTLKALPDQHHVHLNAAVREELRWWVAALQQDITADIHNYTSWTGHESIHAWSDASEWGCGAVSGNEYISLPWTQPIRDIAGIKTKRRNMVFCETLGIATALLTWCHQWANKRVTFHTDCMAAVYGINKGRASTGSSPHLQALYLQINRIITEHNILFRTVHIRGADNIAADHCSRDRVQLYLRTVPSGSPAPTPAATPTLSWRLFGSQESFIFPPPSL